MSTPTQYVPEDFQDTIDLPGPQIDPNAIKKAQGALLQAQQSVRTYTTRVAAIKAQLANKKLPAAKRAAAQKALANAEKSLAAARTTATANQNRVYEFSGEYDKLLGGETRDAYLALKALFNQYGLATLSGKIFEFVKQGYGADTIAMLLQDTKEYKERFAANDARVKAGLPVLNPAEYLSAEAAYRQIMDSAGMPKGFYDSPADFRKWIAADVSPQEIKSRVDMATEKISQIDPLGRAALYQMYGVGEGELAAYFLDRKVAEPILKKQATAGAIGAAALRRGFGLNRLDLESYAELGISGQEAEAAYGRIAENFEQMLGIAGRYGSSWTQREAEQEIFTPGAGQLGKDSAMEKGKRLRSQERALFSGGRGSSTQGLSAAYRQT